jgi:ABC-type nitrate/sulfonate/bicarbonate transport system ATPase subunit
MRYEILPTTGYQGDTMFWTAIRDGEQILLCEVQGETEEDSRRKAQMIVDALEIAEIARNYCKQLCKGERHNPNCPVTGFEN